MSVKKIVHSQRQYTGFDESQARYATFAQSDARLSTLSVDNLAVFVNYGAFHTCTVLSQEPEAMYFPSGDQATAFTESEWPL